MMLRFEWDPKKEAANRRKHGVTFEEAVSVFYDENALLLDDPEHSEDEDRFVLMGISAKLRVLLPLLSRGGGPHSPHIGQKSRQG